MTRVWVSPMRRALKTAILMLKDHPNAANLTLVVVPLCREFLHTTNDLPSDVFELIERFKEGSPECHGLKIDFTMLLHYSQP